MQRFDICPPISVPSLTSVLAVQSQSLSTSWHPHSYRQRPADRAPTPHLIRNILGLHEDPRQDSVQPCLESSSTCSVRSSVSHVSSSSVGPDDDRHLGSRGHVDNGPDWPTSGRRAGHLGNSLAAPDTTLRGWMICISYFICFSL